MGADAAMTARPSIGQYAHDLGSGRVTSRALVEDCLARIADPQGEGARTFIGTNPAAARAAADAADRARSLGFPASRYAGIPVSVKDLFDIAGETTRGGSLVLADAPPASADSTVVARLRAAGLVIIGRTNMTEFAYSGLGLNPHYGTPRNPYGREIGRIPGGSSSGATISVTDGMAVAGLGTDTGGSCRIPAALTGTVGFKPTASRVPRDGVLPLSTSLDSVGSIAPSVACCAVIDAIIAGEAARAPDPFPLAGLRLAVPQSLVLDDMDATVASAFTAAVSALSASGARVQDLPLRELLELPSINAKGGLVAAEAYAWHRRLLATRGAEYDPRVSVRIEKGAEQSAADYIQVRAARLDFMGRIQSRCAHLDALIMPTTPLVAPAIAELADDKNYARINLLMLRNPTLVNFLDGCAVSVPCHRRGEAPVGLMIAGPCGSDQRILAIARAIESALDPMRE